MRFFKPFELPVEPKFPDRTVDIRNYGAREGEDCTAAIRAAITDCAEQGGGRVIVPAGNWLTGPIHLKSNIDLHFAEGAYVEFSTKFEDYLPVVYGILAGNRCYSVSHFVYAYQCENIAITGKGKLHGHGEAWWYMKHHQPGMEDLMKKGKALAPLSERVYDKPEQGVRPRMLQFVECKNVLIEGITMYNSPSWTVHPAWCQNIIVRGITIENPVDSPNTDGINLESCKRGLVENCDVSGGDDMVCFKAGRDADAWDVGIPCEDIEVRNCRTSICRGGLTIGSETSAGVRNGYVHDCELGEQHMCVRIKSMKGRGGFIENLDIENITVKSADRIAVSLTLRYNGEPLDDYSQPIKNMPTMRNISISNFKCGRARMGIEVMGEKGYDIENIYLDNIDIVAETPVSIGNVKNLHMQNINLAETRD